MSLYLVKGKGWRYDFTLKGIRHTGSWFKKKTEARRAEAKRKEEILSPKPIEEIRTDMGFLELVNKRLDYVKAYNSESHYQTYICLARKWVRKWGKLRCGQITREMIEEYMLNRRNISAYTANKDLRYMRASFNYGLKKNLIGSNPTEGIEFFPVEKKVKHVPSQEDIERIISVADPDDKDYLWAIRETMARINEINNLVWDDVNLKERYVILYTRKKRGGHLTPRKIFMTEKLFEILSRRNSERDKENPWVFWHSYWSRGAGKWTSGPYQDRKKIMKILCKRAGVKYFRFHAIRHAGASVMDACNVPIGSIQRILGHENRKTTEIYLHSIGDSERLAMNIYENARKNSHMTLTQEGA